MGTLRPVPLPFSLGKFEEISTYIVSYGNILKSAFFELTSCDGIAKIRI